MRRRRSRTVVLCVGCTLCVLIALAFVVSGWWIIEVQFDWGPTINLVAGRVKYDTGYPNHHQFLDHHRCGWRFWNTWEWQGSVLVTWGEQIIPANTSVTVPTWPFTLVVAIPTLLVRRFVPKFPRGHCRRCGYNLTGLIERRCPDCGEAFEANGGAA